MLTMFNKKEEVVKPNYRQKPDDHEWFLMNPGEVGGNNVKAYNPTIFTHRDRTWMVFRYENNGSYATNLGRVELDEEKLRPIGPVAPLNFVRASSRVQTVDDPRYFRHRNKGMIAHSQGALFNGVWASTVCIAEMDSNNFSSTALLIPNYGKNVNYVQSGKHSEMWTEKNWSYLCEAFGDMYFVYNHHPFEVIKVKFGGRAEVVHKLDFENPWGRILAGGTSFVDLDQDTLITMFHSYTMNDNQRVYDAGFMLVDRTTMKPTFMSKAPVVTSWDDPVNDMRYTLEPDSGWRPLVWYPSGIIAKRKEVTISFGWNDCLCGIAKFDMADITKNLVKLDV